MIGMRRAKRRQAGDGVEQPPTARIGAYRRRQRATRSASAKRDDEADDDRDDGHEHVLPGPLADVVQVVETQSQLEERLVLAHPGLLAGAQHVRDGVDADQAEHALSLVDHHPQLDR